MRSAVLAVNGARQPPHHSAGIAATGGQPDGKYNGQNDQQNDQGSSAHRRTIRT
jgi:hypothetical protein